MKILYLTTSIAEKDFDYLVENAKVVPNPAGQNFHGKVIASLKTQGSLAVYSLVPNREGVLETAKRFGDKPYRYFFAPSSKISRLLFFPSKMVNSIAKENAGEKDLVIVYDSLNITLAKVAKALAKKLKAPRIAILTDDPDNITGVSATYRSACLKFSKDADGYFTLTKGLNEKFNQKQRPFIIREGVVEKADVKPKVLEKPYLYYGGALFEKDGTKDLISAFIAAKPDYLLVISGHGAYEEKVKEAAKENPNIIYLGQISKQENYAYQKGAALLINPRRYNRELDKVSIPSKVLEYLVNGTCVVSTLSTPLREEFPDDINWVEEDFPSFFAKHIDKQGKLVGLKENKGQEKAEGRLGLKDLGLSLYEFLGSISVKS